MSGKPLELTFRFPPDTAVRVVAGGDKPDAEHLRDYLVGVLFAVLEEAGDRDLPRGREPALRFADLNPTQGISLNGHEHGAAALERLAQLASAGR